MSVDNKLFVTEEEEEDRTQDRADVEDESNDVDMTAEENGTSSAVANGPEKEQQEQEQVKSEEVCGEDEEKEEEEEEDPIVEEFPLNISGNDESLHVFQYANRPVSYTHLDVYKRQHE